MKHSQCAVQQSGNSDNSIIFSLYNVSSLGIFSINKFCKGLKFAPS